MQEIIFSKNEGFIDKLKRRTAKAAVSFRKGLLFKRISNYFLVKLSLSLKRPRVWSAPFYLMIEPTNTCNLKCPLCPTGEGDLGRQNAMMDISVFKTAIDELGDYLLELNITNYGEPFLHKNLYEMISYVKGKGIRVIIGTNGHYFKDEDSVRQFILSGVDGVYVSLDGADQDAYSRYRVGGDFEKVARGLKMLVDAKNRLKMALPFIEAQFLVMRHNEGQIEAIRGLAEDIGVDRLILKPVSFNISEWGRQHVQERFKQTMPESESFRLYRMVDGKLQWKKPIEDRCDYLWRGTVILCDGTVVPCCVDPRGDMKMGNVRDGILNIWNGPRYTGLRQQVLLDKKRLNLCSNCPGT